MLCQINLPFVFVKKKHTASEHAHTPLGTAKFVSIDLKESNSVLSIFGISFYVFITV